MVTSHVDAGTMLYSSAILNFELSNPARTSPPNLVPEAIPEEDVEALESKSTLARKKTPTPAPTNGANLPPLLKYLNSSNKCNLLD